MLDERERTIREAIDQAKKERADAERMLSEQTAALAAAQREAALLAERSRQDVETLRAELTSRARKEAEELVAAARRQIQEERAKAVDEIRGQVADLAIAATRRIIESSLDEEAQRKLVQDFIAQLPADRAA
jgi:F-type H+-transporting ATPase subunit b